MNFNAYPLPRRAVRHEFTPRRDHPFTHSQALEWQSGIQAFAIILHRQMQMLWSGRYTRYAAQPHINMAGLGMVAMLVGASCTMRYRVILRDSDRLPSSPSSARS